jgi:uncharacterized membrane protein
MGKHVLAALVATVALVVGGGSSGAATPAPVPVFTITDLGTLPGGSRSVAFGLNASGAAIGYSSPGAHAVLFANGTVVDLGTGTGNFTAHHG